MMKKPPFWWFITRRILIVLTAPIWFVPVGVASILYELYDDWRREYNDEYNREESDKEMKSYCYKPERGVKKV